MTWTALNKGKKSDLEDRIAFFTRQLIHKKGYVCPVDLLMKLDYLSRKDYENWRFGRIAYLEEACKVNLSTLSFVNRSIRRLASELQLVKSRTVYCKYGKGTKQNLRFSKSGNAGIERNYATHYLVRKGI
jgi:hypothetical protein